MCARSVGVALSPLCQNANEDNLLECYYKRKLFDNVLHCAEMKRKTSYFSTSPSASSKEMCHICTMIHLKGTHVLQDNVMTSITGQRFK